jgi:hypothetical protein
MNHLLYEVWTLLKGLDLQGTRFAALYKRLDLQDEEAWELARNLPHDELVQLRIYAEQQIRPQPALPTTDFSTHSASWISLRSLSQSEEQSRRQHTLARLQQL